VAEHRAEALRLAYRDPLTGLPNRASFRDSVTQAIRQTAPGCSLAVVMLDLNRFKHVNDVLGYPVGDQLLVTVAQRLCSHLLRNDDLVARLGGDEFGVLLRGSDRALALSVARRLEQAFELPMSVLDHHLDMGAAIGIACWPADAQDGEALLNRAEVAMYAAKRRGGEPMLYEPSIDVASAQTLTLLGELRQAVESGQLRLVLQPKLALADGRLVGAEALVRWLHPERGMVPPAQFIPFAEQTGFIRVLTRWVFEQAVRERQALLEQGLAIDMSVNLSTRDLLDTELPQRFEALLARHRAPASAFCLEITESAIMEDPQRAIVTLDRLSAIGFKLSIDDFGTGYSSLAYLKRLPVNELKIDQSFVRDMAGSADDAAIVRATIDLAHTIGISVVAEGVENCEAWNLLRHLGCDSRGWAKRRNCRSACTEASPLHGNAMPRTQLRQGSASSLPSGKCVGTGVAANRPRI
jgi:diguanylate cyclase (GGDEF)-like protein